ncbi:3-isopropylmalate dehydratase [Pseudomonas sp. SST3]|uniref:3-isopropylmalate dehydratase n=1 Tax=Pseudomonas sp. SST3 TaxID=2267882 RepID=UPI000DFCF2A1|nr:3-isopropylmalate dehydratase [Pseudomonas sp. SST3]NKQ12288.1 3-isopropylmalate dehydratase [Pseudomonas sp. SST3]
MRLLLALVPLLALAGCSSWQADPADIKPVPEERLRGYQTPVTNGGELVVTRDFGLRGGGCYVAVLVDRKIAARIHVGEQVRLHVPAGMRIVSIESDPEDDTLCGKGNLLREKAARVEVGEALHFRISADNRIGFDIQQVEAK